jgi:hypothetical protein
MIDVARALSLVAKEDDATQLLLEAEVIAPHLVRHSPVVRETVAQHCQLRMDQAFDLMRRYARSHNTRLAEVARGLAERTLDPDSVTGGNRPPG